MYSGMGAHIVATNDLFLSYSGMSSIIFTSLREGHAVANCWSHCGPCHHSWRFTISCVTRCEMRSAGFSKVLTCFQSLMLVVSWIHATLLSMNVCHLIASEEIHEKNQSRDGCCESSLSKFVKTCQFVLPATLLQTVPTLGKLLSSLMWPWNVNNKLLYLPLMINWHQVETCSVCHFWSICEIMNLYFDCSL